MSFDEPCDGARILEVRNNTSTTFDVFWVADGTRVSIDGIPESKRRLGTAAIGINRYPVSERGSPYPVSSDVHVRMLCNMAADRSGPPN